ncbi:MULTISPECIES: hypothetical protein [Clostridium]|uniref:hypothetical protein n=1 Tax=Clostridium sporogenes TaxID=1509 RepID=UPI0001794F0A|nr:MULTISPECIES: hypothetical protein [Clostridium]EDU35765.1 hypothetical protein CLOSPO_01930 [Clostridium sporogenes ATCC 15579]MBO0538441.1 hypothetical protein [Clostridium botulinum]MBO0550523.1 hypothetical protein [Clostridium botulinum]MBO0554876.1 hypothetical protein [Clostridium botulinum]MBO0559135.1 hypothetical protein [Clostridium botulinum]
MGKVKFRKIKYKKIKIIIGYSEYKFNYYEQKYKGKVILLINKNFKDKSRILHKVIKRYK